MNANLVTHPSNISASHIAVLVFVKETYYDQEDECVVSITTKYYAFPGKQEASEFITGELMNPKSKLFGNEYCVMGAVPLQTKVSVDLG